MCHYKHLSIKEREKLLLLSNSGNCISEIAKILGRNKSTISRELRRNSIDDTYSAVDADAIYHKRRTNSRRKLMFSDLKLKNKVLKFICDMQWSPEQISNRLKLEKSTFSVSYNTIYRAIYRGILEPAKLSHGQRGIARKLRHRGKTRHTKEHIETRGKIVISNSIEERCKEAEERSEIGHWESDTIIGKKNSECIVTNVDRKSRYLLAAKAKKKASIPVRDAMITLFKPLSADKLKTITPDRGKEFAKHQEVSSALKNIPFYFPQPHAPWQRGTNENTNGLLREYFPKGTDIKNFTDKQITEFVYRLNTRPRKCLGWKSPYEVFFDISLHLT